MRTRSALLVASCVLAASVVTGGALNESVGADKGIPPNHPQLTKFSKVSDIVMDKCMACHSRNYDLPFYAKIPGIKEIIEKDFNDGLRAMDLNLELVEAAKDKPIGEATLAKMEWVIAFCNLAILAFSSTKPCRPRSLPPCTGAAVCRLKTGPPSSIG